MAEVRISTDYGRCSCPLFIVENQRLLIKKKDIQALQQRVPSILVILQIFILDDFIIKHDVSVVMPFSFSRKPQWHDIVFKGFLEYIDMEEEETTMISITIKC